MALGHIVHFVGNRSPSVSDVLTVDGVPVNLTGSTVKLQMRPVGSSTLKVDAAATIDTPTAGTVHYDWAALDVDTAGRYVAWWRVTLSGGTVQDSPEFIVEIRAHSASANEYISASELKDTLGITKGYADIDVQDAVTAASRAVDDHCRQSFFLGPAAETRTFTPIAEDYLMIDPASTITTVTVQGTAITLGTNYSKQPANAALIGQPWNLLRSLNGYAFPRGIPDSVTVLGQFGWATVPAQVRIATKIMAARYLLRPRQAVFGVAGIGLDSGAAAISTFDPDVEAILEPFVSVGMIE